MKCQQFKIKSDVINYSRKEGKLYYLAILKHLSLQAGMSQQLNRAWEDCINIFCPEETILCLKFLAAQSQVLVTFYSIIIQSLI